MKYVFVTLLSIICISTFAQGFYDLNSIQKIELTFDQTNWDALLDAEKSGNGDYIMAASVTINGVTLDSVGAKYKGNSSYNANQVKNPWHIELDTYKDHDYQGYTDIKLANGAKDPSFLRDVLAYQVVRKYMDAPLANYAILYVNGEQIGLYANTESVSKKFVKSRFGSKSNAFMKCSPPDGAGPGSSDLPNLVYMGQDSTDYYDAYELKSDAGWQEHIDLCDTLASHTSDIERVLDVDRILWMLAFDHVIVNLDSYIGTFAQNYYLYRDDYDRFLPVVWDLNESFGVFSMTGTSNLNNTTAKQQMSHLLHLNDANWPLMQELLAVDMYKRMYLAHCKTILLENFDNGAYYDSALVIQSIIDTAVNDDPNKFYTHNNFLSNLTSDVNAGGGGGGGGGGSFPGITNLMDGRSSYLLSQSDFTQTEPTISNISLSNASPLIGESVSILADITNENAVYIGYRSNKFEPFVRVQMFDDGAHDDGAANDGTYGVALVLSNASIQYYIYAENSNIGKFSPVRAEYEYHTLTAANALDGVVINELLASNDAIASDQDGEFDDWIELYNNSTSSIDLSGYFLSDDASDLTQWEFPAGTSIDANDYLIIWADDDELQSGLHANFKLSASGESVLLVDPSESIVDLVDFTAQSEDISYGRYPNGTGDFQLMTPTFNSENFGTLGIQDVNEADGFSMVAFPNPANDYIMIRFNQDDAKEVSIFDLHGSLVFQRSVVQAGTVNTSNWSPGIYFVKAENVVLKIVVQ